MKVEEKDIEKIKREIIARIQDSKVQEKDVEYVKELQLLEANDTYYGLSENDLFLVKKEEEKDGKKISIYDIYDKEGNLIGKTDKEGNIELTVEYKKMLEEKYKDLYKKLGLDKRKIEVKQIEKQLPEKNNEEKPKEIEEEKIGKSENSEGNKETENQEEIEKSEELSPEEQQEKMESSLGLDKKDIKSSSEIKDSEFYKLVPEAKEYNGNVSIVYVGSTNEFMIVGEDRKTGEYMPLKTVEASRAVQAGEENKTIDMGRDGNDIKQESLKAILSIKGDKEYAFAAKLEGMNPIEFKELRYDRSTGKPIARNMQTTHQYPTTREVDKITNKTDNENTGAEVEKYEEQVKKGDKEITIDEIKDKTPEQEKEQRKKDREDEKIEKNKKSENEDEENEGDGFYKTRPESIHDVGNKYYNDKLFKSCK